MFSREGSARSDGQNRRVAGYLACVGGFVNSSGFVLIGTFTSHVTGNVGRLANDAATGQFAAAIAAFSLVLCFFAGAFCASLIIENRVFGGAASRAYAGALGAETVLLLVFTGLSYLTVGVHARVQDAEAALLCAAMGMQNALVTRLSGAIVRTTHLTGVVTDLGIECARWFRFWQRSLFQARHLLPLAGSTGAEQPALATVLLLSTIACGFLLGATLGAFLTVRYGHGSMLGAAVAVGACAVYAWFN